MASYRYTCHLAPVLLAWTALVPLRPADAFQASAGQVQGKVVLDSDGSAVSGATVTLVQIGATPKATSMNPPNSGIGTPNPNTISHR